MTKQKKTALLKIIALTLAFVAVISAVTVILLRVGYKHRYPQKYTEYIEKYADEYSVPVNLLYATIKVESGFDENAKSESGAIGLTQIMPDTLAWLQTKTGEKYTEADLSDPEISIKYCALFYSILLEKFGNAETAAAAYHAGINRVDGWLKDPEYSSDGVTLDKIPSRATAHYVSKVTKAVNVYGNLYKEEQ